MKKSEGAYAPSGPPKMTPMHRRQGVVLVYILTIDGTYLGSFILANHSISVPVGWLDAIFLARA